MKIFNILVALVILLGLSVSTAYAGTFSDNFNDGNADGWWLGYSQHTPWVSGNWRVENGTLAQDQGADGFFALVNNLQVSSQTLETQLKLNGPSGYGGLVFWYQDNNNWVNVRLYPAAGEIWVNEDISGQESLSRYSYQSNENAWYTLKVTANSTNGQLDIYINDNLLLTHFVNTQNKIGQSGIMNGNAGGYFDNFMLSSSSITEPLTDKSQCKNNGWRLFNNPIFKNQGSCVSYLESK